MSTPAADLPANETVLLAAFEGWNDAGSAATQALEHLHGVRDEGATRALIAQENRRYARRQLIWFRKEPNLRWFVGPGESPSTVAAACRLLDERLNEPGRPPR